MYFKSYMHNYSICIYVLFYHFQMWTSVVFRMYQCVMRMQTAAMQSVVLTVLVMQDTLEMA